MSDDVSDIARYYNSDPAREHCRLEQHQLEYDLTWRYLDRYLPSRGSILEVGAATGRYTLELAKRGYAITAVDLSAALIERCRENLADQGLEKHVELVVADARDLTQVGGKRFEAVLLMGPLYHLVAKTDRTAALRQAFDRLQEGGILFSSFLSRFGIMGDLIKNNPGWIEEQAEVQSLLACGRRPDDFPRGGFRGYFAERSEIAPLHQAIGFQTITVAGIEPGISADDESYNRLEGKHRRLWLDLFYKMSDEGSIIGASRHLLYIGKKTTGENDGEARRQPSLAACVHSCPSWIENSPRRVYE
jgi:S-adenosylmethionine-dependent methyltransferase